MKAEDAMAICEVIFEPSQLKFVWSQADCELAARGHMKPLEKIWRTFPHLYSAFNTIIIDDTDGKIMIEEKVNHIHIPEFNVVDGDFGADRALSELCDAINQFMLLHKDLSAIDHRELVTKFESGKHDRSFPLKS